MLINSPTYFSTIFVLVITNIQRHRRILPHILFLFKFWNSTCIQIIPALTNFQSSTDLYIHIPCRNPSTTTKRCWTCFYLYLPSKTSYMHMPKYLLWQALKRVLEDFQDISVLLSYWDFSCLQYPIIHIVIEELYCISKIQNLDQLIKNPL